MFSLETLAKKLFKVFSKLFGGEHHIVHPRLITLSSCLLSLIKVSFLIHLVNCHPGNLGTEPGKEILSYVAPKIYILYSFLCQKEDKNFSEESP